MVSPASPNDPPHLTVFHSFGLLIGPLNFFFFFFRQQETLKQFTFSDELDCTRASARREEGKD